MDIARNCVFDSNTKTVDGLCGVRCLGNIEIVVNPLNTELNPICQ